MLISKSLVHNGRDEFLKIFSKITDTLKKLVYKFKKEKTKEDPWIDYNLDNTTALLLLLDKFDLHHIYKKQELTKIRYSVSIHEVNLLMNIN